MPLDIAPDPRASTIRHKNITYLKNPPDLFSITVARFEFSSRFLLHTVGIKMVADPERAFLYFILELLI